MTEYIVTARKWRPMVFEDVVGQNHVTTTLRNALLTGRLAHAYLFSGPRGCGKTTTARLLAKAVNCAGPKDANPDNECESCREITEGRSFDVLEIDGASNRGVEEIRNLRESVRYGPAKGTRRVYIIDEVHMLTKEAFNALLKTLEEPPAHVLFIFATTEIHKVPATILSRCQRFDFRRIATGEIAGKLSSIAQAEQVTIDNEALHLVARRGDGSLRDAQSLFDQVVSLCGTTVTYAQILEALHIVDQEVYFRVSDLMRARNAKGGLDLVDELLARGYDIREFLLGLMEHFRNLLVVKTTGSTALVEASDTFRERYEAEAEAFTVADLLRYQRFLAGTEAAIRWSAQPRFRLEADMVQLIQLQHAMEVGEVLAGLEELHRRLGEPSSTRLPPAKDMPRGSRKPPNDAAPRADSRPRPTVALGELSSRWMEFLQEVRAQRISLWSVLEATHPLEVHGSSVRVACQSDFQVDSMARHREVLSGIFQKVFGVPAMLEGVVAAEGSGASAPASAPAPAQEEHPVITALKRELGAEPI